MQNSTIRTFWYVDLENVHCHYDYLIPNMARHDRVYIVYSSAVRTLDVSVCEMLFKKMLHPFFLYSPLKGNNAADFVLSAELGHLCFEYPDIRHVILSNDKGYMSAVAYLRNKGYNVELKEASLKKPLTDTERSILCECKQRGGSLQDLNSVCGKYATGMKQSALYKKLKECM